RKENEKILKNVRAQVQVLSEEVSNKSLKLRELESKLAVAVKSRKIKESKELGGLPDTDQPDAEDAEERIKTMATHLLKKQEQIDRLTAHRNSLALQLDASHRATQQAERKLRQTQNNPDFAYYRDRATRS
ncbi:hypothetical protein AAMO2058_000603800, partial [Amorphochlora amoebiformis]